MTIEAHIGLALGSLELDAEIEVKPGEVLALLGPNGAGKSTILRAVAGLHHLDFGRIAIDGTPVDDPERGVFVEPEHRPIGVVFQDYLLFEHMSVIENVAFGLRARGNPKREARRQATEWLDRVGLAAYASEQPNALSGGQAQRAALARVLAVSPRVLLLDEPLAALDAGTRATVRRDLRRFLESFDGMRLIVTHDPVDAYAIADRVAIVEHGRIVQSGTLAAVTARPRSRYVADLVGINLLTGTVADGVLQTSSGEPVVVADAEPGPAYAVIHPHSVTLNRSAPLGSSARNTWRGTIVDIDRLGDRVRVGIHGGLALTAEITASAADELALRLGDDVYASVKATEIEVSPS